MFDIINPFLQDLNSLHLSLVFTMALEENNSLPFLYVLVERKDGQIITGVHRKTIFTGLYTS